MYSASRPRAASSPLPQAFNRPVISSVRVSMDGPCSRGPIRNIHELWPLLGLRCRLYQRKGNRQSA